MSHKVTRTEDNSQDTCLNCGAVGDLSKPCPQPGDSEGKIRKELSDLKKNLRK